MNSMQIFQYTQVWKCACPVGLKCDSTLVWGQTCWWGMQPSPRPKVHGFRAQMWRVQGKKLVILQVIKKLQTCFFTNWPILALYHKISIMKLYSWPLLNNFTTTDYHFWSFSFDWSLVNIDFTLQRVAKLPIFFIQHF